MSGLISYVAFAFGSCYSQSKPSNHFSVVVKTKQIHLTDRRNVRIGQIKSLVHSVRKECSGELGKTKKAQT